MNSRETDGAELLKRAHAAFRIGELELAEKLVAVLERTAPDSPEVKLLSGSIKGRQGRYEEAVALFRGVLTAKPGNAEALNNIGVMYRRLGRPADAVRMLQTASARAPRRADIHYNLGNTYKQLGDADSAAAAYRRAIELNPAFTGAYNNLGTLYDTRKAFDEAEKVFALGLEADGSNPVLKYNLGVTLANENRFEEAHDAFREAVRTRPGWVEGLNNLGIVLNRLGRNEEAIETFDRLLRLQPKNPVAKNNLAAVYTALGKTERAEQYLQSALEDDPAYLRAALNLGSLLHDSGSSEEAYRKLSSMVRLEPDNNELRHLLARVCLTLGRFDESETHLSWLLSQEPDSPRVLRQLGTLSFRRGDRERGERYYRKAIALESSAHETRIELAGALRSAGELAAAERELVELVSHAPDHIAAQLLLGELYLEQKKGRAAADLFSAFLSSHPGDKTALRGLARAYHEIGDTPNAVRAAEELVNRHGAGNSAEDLSGLSESLEFYEEVVKPYGDSFDSSWEERLRELDERDGSEPDERETGLEDESDSLLLSDLANLDEYAPTLLDPEPDTEQVPEHEPDQAPGTGTDSDLHDPAGAEASVGTDDFEEMYETPAAEPGSRSAPERCDPDPYSEPSESSLSHLADEPEPEDLETLFEQAGREIEAEKNEGLDDAGGRDGTALSNRDTAGLRSGRTEPAGLRRPPEAYPGERDDRLEAYRDSWNPEPPTQPQPVLSSRPVRSTPQMRPAPGFDSSAHIQPSGIPFRPAVPCLQPRPAAAEPAETFPEAPAGREPRSIPEAPESGVTGTPNPAPVNREQRPAPHAVQSEKPDTLADREARLLAHLVEMARHLPPDSRDSFSRSELRLKIERLRAVLEGRDGLKRKLERRAGFLLPEPRTELNPALLERTFSYLEHLIAYHPDTQIGLALKSKLSHIVQRIHTHPEAKDLE